VAKKKSTGPARRPRVSGWIKWEKDLETDPRFMRMVRLLRNNSVTGALPERIVTVAAIGALVKFWCYADTHLRADNVLDIGISEIDELVGLPGFAGALPKDWLVEIDADHIQLPDYQQHSGVVAKRQALTQKRVANHRERQRNAQETQEIRSCNADALPDQTRPDQEKKEENPADAGVILDLPDETEAHLDPDDYLIWRSGLQYLGADKRSLLGRLVKQHGKGLLARKLSELIALPDKPTDPTGYLIGALRRLERRVVV